MDQKENGVMRDSSSSLKPAYTLSVFVGGSVSLLTSVMYLSIIPQAHTIYIYLYTQDYIIYNVGYSSIIYIFHKTEYLRGFT